MRMTPPLPHPAQQADDAARAILAAALTGEPAIRVDSPPGAGKTGVVERVAIQEMGILGGRAMVATQTNQQACDMARRFAADFPRFVVHLFVRGDLRVPGDVEALSQVRIVRTSAALPAGPCIVVANASRWSWTDQSQVERFTRIIVDEAFQLPDYRFHQIAGMADRLVLVGDPGQIAPVVSCDIDRWQGDPAGPHVACPVALTARHPGIPQLSLPVSRRLVPDTVALVQRAFYPALPFQALVAPGVRGLTTALPGMTAVDQAIDRAAAGASIVQLELPPLITGEVDEHLAETVISLISQLLARGTMIQDDQGEALLTPEMVGVVCSHVSQVNAIYERLPNAWTGVLVETADRFQGLERPIMIVHHPLSGRSDVDQFHLDAGRLCVMLSRHRIACFIVARGGIDAMLQRALPSGERILGVAEDAEYIGWQAHETICADVCQHRRVVPIP